MIGEIVGEYRIVSQLAPGGVGDAYFGEHKDSGTKASIKILHAEMTANAAATQAYLDTVRAVGKIKHAGTLEILDAGLDGAGRGYVVTEVLDGETLAKRIEVSGRLSVTQIGEIARQLANVLAATHEEGIVHGDVRPDAVVLLAQGEGTRESIKVTEFGLATLKRALGIAIGPVYTAPELLGSGEPVDWRIDAYGLGCLAFEMATGRPPFLGASADEVRTKHLEQSPPAARSHMPDVPPALDMLIGRLLSKQPTDRYSSMREIGRLFEGIAGGGGGSRPLAITAEQPAVTVGELGDVTVGEIMAKPLKQPASPAPDESQSSVVASGAHELHTPTAPRPAVTPDQTTMMTARKRSKLPLIVFALFLVAGAAALAFILIR